MAPLNNNRKTALHWCANHLLEIGKYEQSSAIKILNACNWGILNVIDIVS